MELQTGWSNCFEGLCSFLQKLPFKVIQPFQEGTVEEPLLLKNRSSHQKNV